MTHPARPFTLHEQCPRCNEADATTTVLGKPRCTSCNETKERVRTFATLAELQAYVVKPPAWG